MNKIVLIPCLSAALLVAACAQNPDKQALRPRPDMVTPTGSHIKEPGDPERGAIAAGSSGYIYCKDAISRTSAINASEAIARAQLSLRGCDDKANQPKAGDREKEN